MNNSTNVSKRFLGVSKASLIAAAIASSLMLTACGGGGASDALDVASTAKAMAATTGPAFQINAPLANTMLTGTVIVKGPLATNWTNVTVVDMTSGKTIVNVTPSGGSFLTNVDTTTQTNGTHTWKFTATNSKNGATSVLNLSVNVYNIAGATTTTGSIFYGANGHNNSGGAYDISSIALQLQQLQDLHVKIYRNEVYNQASANKLATIAPTMAAGGVTVFPVILSGISARTSEQDAYNVGYALGQQTATAYKYPYYEVSNELGAQAIGGNYDGVYPQQFDNTKFMKARGVIRGMIDGIRSVDTNGKIVIGGDTWLHYAFYQMLATGTQPDGTTGHPIVNWDITAWHWYSDQGDITNACGGTGCHDVLGTLQQLGKPIWLTEYGVRPWLGSDQQIATYMTGNTMMSQFVSVAAKYNIQSIQVYQLYDDPAGGEGNYGLLQNDGITPKAQYAAFKNFVLANPK